MSATITPATGTTGPGRSATKVSYGMGPKPLVRYPFTVTFDSSYPTGGESIAVADVTNSPYSVLRTVDNIQILDSIAPGGTGGSSAGDVMHGVMDYTNKKVLLFVNGTQATNATSYALIILRCVAEGYA